MRILFICDSRLHPHDYGADFLIQGAYAMLGAENVFEWPQKPNLHLAIGEDRDECQLDCDAWLPLKAGCDRFDLATNINHLARDGMLDAVILTSAYGTATPWGEVCDRLWERTPIIGLHYDDEQADTRPQLERIAGRKLTAYFHRENPPAGAFPLFLTQPLSRVRPVAYKPNLRGVFYHGSTHWPDDVCPRRKMIESIEREVPAEQRSLALTHGQREGRLRPEMYRERLWESAVSVVWNSGPNFPAWQSNRFAESLALGCAVVAERPPYKSFDDLGDCVTWIDRPEDAGAVVADLLTQDLCGMQYDAQRWFIEHGSSEAQLRRILASVGLKAERR